LNIQRFDSPTQIRGGVSNQIGVMIAVTVRVVQVSVSDRDQVVVDQPESGFERRRARDRPA